LKFILAGLEVTYDNKTTPPERDTMTSYPAFINASRDRDIPMMLELLAEGADVDEKDALGYTSLHYALNIASHDVARTLLNAGANIHKTVYKNGRTALHEALGCANLPEIVDALLKAGADANARDRDGLTPFHYAASATHLRRVYIQEFVEALLAKGADINAKDNDGRTPLHYANRPEIVHALVAKGADVHAKDNHGQTPLDFASHWLVRSALQKEMYDE